MRSGTRSAPYARHTYPTPRDDLCTWVRRYLGSLVLEQLVHTCAVTSEGTETVVGLGIRWTACACMMIAGFMRAYNPLGTTDIPFLIFMVSPLLFTIVPPRPASFSGPLCAPPTFFAAAERVIRAVGFASVFCTFVFVSMPPVASGSTLTVIRAFTSSAWVLSSPPVMLVFVLPQCMFAVWSRLATRDRDPYNTIPMVTPPPEREDIACVDSSSSMEYAFTETSVLAETPTSSKSRIFSKDELAKIAERM